MDTPLLGTRGRWKNYFSYQEIKDTIIAVLLGIIVVLMISGITLIILGIIIDVNNELNEAEASCIIFDNNDCIKEKSCCWLNEKNSNTFAPFSFENNTVGCHTKRKANSNCFHRGRYYTDG